MHAVEGEEEEEMGHGLSSWPDPYVCPSSSLSSFPSWRIDHSYSMYMLATSNRQS